MPKLPRSLLILAVLLPGLLVAAAVGESNPVRRVPQRQAADEGRVIVKFRAGSELLSTGRTQAQGLGAVNGPQAAAALGTRLGLALVDGRAIDGRSQVIRAPGVASRALLARLQADSGVEWAVEDGRRYALAAPNDPLYAGNQPDGTTPTVGQWYLRAPAGTVVSSIDVEAAWNLTEGDANLVVGVLDTGVRGNHPDLAGKLLPGYDFITDAAIANDGGGRDADASDPGDWITSAENASGEFKGCGQSDSSWHGTQTAGLVGAATHNGIGMAGVAPNVKLLPVRVLGKCGGYDSDIVVAMRWAAGLSVPGVATNPNPAKVLNLSLGSSGPCGSAYTDTMAEMTAAGVVVVAAAGNEGLAVGSPANCPGVIAVAAVRHVGTKVGFSDLGPEVTLSAPGGNCVNDVGPCLYPMLTTSDAGNTSPVASFYTDSFNSSLGTSFSSPVVAGTVALMLSVRPDLSPGEVGSLLRRSARAFPAAGGGVPVCHAPNGIEQSSECVCTGATCGAGLLDAGAAVAAALDPSLPIPVIAAEALSISLGDVVALDGTASSAPAGRTLASYQWAITEGASLARFSGATNAATASLSATGAGQVTVRLTVTDSNGANAVFNQSLLVAAAPTASVSVGDSTPMVGDLVALDGSASAARGAAVLDSYLWEITAGASLAEFSGGANASTASLSINGTGSITVRLTVTDSNGAASSASQTLKVSAPPSSGGGGGSLAPVWALGLLGLGLLLGRRPQRPVPTGSQARQAGRPDDEPSSRA